MNGDLAKLGDAGIFVDPRAYGRLDSWHASAARLRANDPLPLVELDEYVPFRAVTRHAAGEPEYTTATFVGGPKRMRIRYRLPPAAA